MRHPNAAKGEKSTRDREFFDRDAGRRQGWAGVGNEGREDLAAMATLSESDVDLVISSHPMVDAVVGRAEEILPFLLQPFGAWKPVAQRLLKAEVFHCFRDRLWYVSQVRSRQ